MQLLPPQENYLPNGSYIPCDQFGTADKKEKIKNLRTVIKTLYNLPSTISAGQLLSRILARASMPSPKSKQQKSLLTQYWILLVQRIK
jgi:hypothetical protein